MNIIEKDVVYHVGKMNIAEKSTTSYEGSGLSVSEHPNEWRMITPLLGTTKALIKQKGQFVDYYSLTKGEKEHIQEWGKEHGLIEKGECYRYYYYDDELKQRCYIEFETEKEALIEADGDKRNIKKISGIVATDKLLKVSLQKKIDPSNVMEQLVIVFFDRTQRNIDGIWWNEKLDIQKYSAPRGVIFNRNIGTWYLLNSDEIAVQKAKMHLKQILDKGSDLDKRRLDKFISEGSKEEYHNNRAYKGVHYFKGRDHVYNILTLGKYYRVQDNFIEEYDTSNWSKNDIPSLAKYYGIEQYINLLLAQKLR